MSDDKTVKLTDKQLAILMRILRAEPVHEDNSAAKSAGLTPGGFYRTSNGIRKVVYK